jgi:phytanoyl-CoA hydroxylase
MAMIDLKSYRETGFVHVRGLFAPEQMDALRADAWRVFGRQLGRHGLLDGAGEEPAEALYTYFREHTAEFANCGKQIQHLVSLHRLALDPAVLDVVGALGLQDPNIAIRPVLFFNNPKLARDEFYWKTPPHQDWRSMQGSLDSVVAWVALTDVDADLGALEVVPGSHRRGLLAERFENGFGQTGQFADDDFVPVATRKGDALFFSSFLVHRSGTNVTDAIRWSAQFRFNNLAEATFVARGYPHSFIYKPVDELLTPDFPAAADVERVFR